MLNDRQEGTRAMRRAVWIVGLALVSLPGAAQEVAAPDAAGVVQAIAGNPIETIQRQLAAFNAHDVIALRDNVAVDFMWFSVESDLSAIQLRGREAFEQSMIGYFGAFPAARAEIESPVAVGAFVSVIERVFWPGAQGEERSQASLAIYEVRDGLIYRVWYYPAAQ